MILNPPRRQQDKRTAASEQVKAFLGNHDGASLIYEIPPRIRSQTKKTQTKDNFDNVKSKRGGP